MRAKVDGLELIELDKYPILPGIKERAKVLSYLRENNWGIVLYPPEKEKEYAKEKGVALDDETMIVEYRKSPKSVSGATLLMKRTGQMECTSLLLRDDTLDGALEEDDFCLPLEVPKAVEKNGRDAISAFIREQFCEFDNDCDEEEFAKKHWIVLDDETMVVKHIDDHGMVLVVSTVLVRKLKMDGLYHFKLMEEYDW